MILAINKTKSILNDEYNRIPAHSKFVVAEEARDRVVSIHFLVCCLDAR